MIYCSIYMIHKYGSSQGQSHSDTTNVCVFWLCLLCVGVCRSRTYLFFKDGYFFRRIINKSKPVCLLHTHQGVESIRLEFNSVPVELSVRGTGGAPSVPQWAPAAGQASTSVRLSVQSVRPQVPYWADGVSSGDQRVPPCGCRHPVFCQRVTPETRGATPFWTICQGIPSVCQSVLRVFQLQLGYKVHQDDGVTAGLEVSRGHGISRVPLWHCAPLWAGAVQGGRTLGQGRGRGHVDSPGFPVTSRWQGILTISRSSC